MPEDQTRARRSLSRHAPRRPAPDQFFRHINIQPAHQITEAAAERCGLQHISPRTTRSIACEGRVLIPIRSSCRRRMTYSRHQPASKPTCPQPHGRFVSRGLSPAGRISEQYRLCFATPGDLRNARGRGPTPAADCEQHPLWTFDSDVHDSVSSAIFSDGGETL